MANKVVVFSGVAAVVAAGEMRTVSAKPRFSKRKPGPFICTDILNKCTAPEACRDGCCKDYIHMSGTTACQWCVNAKCGPDPPVVFAKPCEDALNGFCGGAKNVSVQKCNGCVANELKKQGKGYLKNVCTKTDVDLDLKMFFCQNQTYCQTMAKKQCTSATDCHNCVHNLKAEGCFFENTVCPPADKCQKEMEKKGAGCKTQGRGEDLCEECLRLKVGTKKNCTPQDFTKFCNGGEKTEV